jgi:AraC family transcriptional regulator
MSAPAIDSPAALQNWFRSSGVAQPLRTCIGPLPGSRASIARWSDTGSDWTIQTVCPHPDAFRIAVMLEPLESQIWVDDRPLWGGVIGANRFRICAPGAVSRWRRLSDCDIVNIFVPIARVDEFARARGGGATLCDTSFHPDREVLDLVRRMLAADALAGALADRFCDALVDALVCYLLEHYGRDTQAADDAEGPGSLAGWRLRRVQDHLASHLGDDVSIATLAALCGVSESHFSREFHRCVGLPPHQYVLKLRLDRARDALLEGDRSLTDIAGECGFHSASHFSRAFALRFGLPPARFRRLQQPG